MVVQVDGDSTYRRADTGEVLGLWRDLPPGAIRLVEGESVRINGDGAGLVVRLPNGHDWYPGSTAKNCPRKGEEHDCWCVHGLPPHLTVNKTPKPGRSTCAAGAGSIQSGTGSEAWHGFLRNGELVVA